MNKLPFLNISQVENMEELEWTQIQIICSRVFRGENKEYQSGSHKLNMFLQPKTLRLGDRIG